jgi:hypothetical protein
MARKPEVGTHSIDEFKEIVQEFKKESDRATVILSAAKLDAQLYLLLSKALKPSTGNNDELLDGDSPLGTFSARINISVRLGLIDPLFGKSLHLIRKIRNAFAHEFKSMSLSSGGHADRIRELLVHFKDHNDYHDFKESYFKDDKTLSADFKIIVGIAIIRLDTAIHYAAVVNDHGTVLIPPSWKRKMLMKNQKPKKKPKKKRSKLIPARRSLQTTSE